MLFCQSTGAIRLEVLGVTDEQSIWAPVAGDCQSSAVNLRGDWYEVDKKVPPNKLDCGETVADARTKHLKRAMRGSLLRSDFQKRRGQAEPINPLSTEEGLDTRGTAHPNNGE